ncbi:hypothetical protein HDU93_000725 [Gonapodya sp. JEL0774]|nr:hypothetical protein HDU93_000725 [Gonapodya sp. JEL0774]
MPAQPTTMAKAVASGVPSSSLSSPETPAQTAADLSESLNQARGLVEPLRAGAESLREIVAYCQTLYYLKPEAAESGSAADGGTRNPPPSREKPPPGKSKSGKGLSSMKTGAGDPAGASIGLTVPPNACPPDLADPLRYGAAYTQARDYAVQALSSVAYQVGEVARVVQDLVVELDVKVLERVPARLDAGAQDYDEYRRSLGRAALSSLRSKGPTDNVGMNNGTTTSSYLMPAVEQVAPPEGMARPRGLAPIFPTRGGHTPASSSLSLPMETASLVSSANSASAQNVNIIGRLTRSSMATSMSSVRRTPDTANMPPPPAAPKLPSALQRVVSSTSVQGKSTGGSVGGVAGAGQSIHIPSSSTTSTDAPATSSSLCSASVRLSTFQTEPSPSVFGGGPATSAGLFKRSSTAGEGAGKGYAFGGKSSDDVASKPLPGEFKLGRLGTLTVEPPGVSTPGSPTGAVAPETGFILGRLARPATGTPILSESHSHSRTASTDSLARASSANSLQHAGSSSSVQRTPSSATGPGGTRQATGTQPSASRARPAVRAPPPPPQPVASHPPSPLATVLYPFQPETEMELHVEPGWIVRVGGEDVGEGWCEVEVVDVREGQREDERGRIVGRKGLVPRGYVKVDGE